MSQQDTTYFSPIFFKLETLLIIYFYDQIKIRYRREFPKYLHLFFVGVKLRKLHFLITQEGVS